MTLLAQDERKTRRIGALTLVVLGLASVFVVFVYQRLDWGDRVRIKVYLHSTGGLREGGDFVVAGRPVGRIESIALSPRGATSPLDGEEGVVVTVAIEADAARQIMRGGDVFVTSRGVLSGRYLEIGAAPEPTPPLHDGDELLGRDPPSLDRVLQRTWDNLSTASRFAAEVTPELDALRAQVDQLRVAVFGTSADPAGRLPQLDRLAPLVDDAVALYGEVGRMREAGLGGDAGLARIASLASRGRSLLGSARATFAELRTNADTLEAAVTALRGRLGSKGATAIAHVELAIARAREALAKVDPLLAQIDALQQHIARKDGSLLKLMNDPEFPEDAKALGRILKRQPWRVMQRPPK